MFKEGLGKIDCCIENIEILAIIWVVGSWVLYKIFILKAFTNSGVLECMYPQRVSVVLQVGNGFIPKFFDW